MTFFKTIWGLFFRLFPCPTRMGLSPIGNPGPNSPVLVTCNFDLTVKRLTRALRGMNVWMLVAESRGVNVWCAAAGDEFNTRSVVSSVKTSGVGDLVDHRTLILPPLCAPGVNAAEVRRQTGWAVRWGPVRARDLPRFFAEDCLRDEQAKRVSYNWRERIDTACGSLFPFYLLGAIGFVLLGRHLLLNYLATAAAVFLLFMLGCPWIPGKRGLAKVLLLEIPLGVILLLSELLSSGGSSSIPADTIIAMIMLFVYGSELGGLSPNMKSELDPLLARLRVPRIGNAAFAGTIRTELLNGYRKLTYNREKCIGCQSCVEVCPVGVWGFDKQCKRAVLTRKDLCTACRACIVQCQSRAIRAPLLKNPPA